MDYRIAIPTHRRPMILRGETLAFLREARADLTRVDLFLSDEQDRQAYAEVAVGLNVVLGQQPITNVRDKFNAIHFHYPIGTRVFVMEDDVRLIECVAPRANASRPVADVDAVIRQGFTSLPRGGIFGVAPHANAFYMSGKVTRTLKLVVAHAFGFMSTRKPELAVQMPSKTDYERTCRYFVEYGETVRLDRYGVATVSYTQEGGMQADHTRQERAELERRSCEWLVQHYPHLLRHNPDKPSVFAELSFNRCTYKRDQLRLMQQGIERRLREAAGGA